MKYFWLLLLAVILNCTQEGASELLDDLKIAVNRNRSFVEAISLLKLSNVEEAVNDSKHCRFLSVGGEFSGTPGVELATLPASSYSVFEMPGFGDVVLDQAHEEWMTRCSEFALEYNLLTYHRFAKEKKFPNLELSFQESRE